MRNAFSKKAYDKIKNERYTLVTFKDNRRCMTIAGCSADRLVEELLKCKGVTHMLFNQDDLGAVEGCNRDIAFFINKKAELAEIEREALEAEREKKLAANIRKIRAERQALRDVAEVRHPCPDCGEDNCDCDYF